MVTDISEKINQSFPVRFMLFHPSQAQTQAQTFFKTAAIVLTFTV